MKKIVLMTALMLLASTSAWAQFTNGGFENGDWTGWTTGSGYWYGGSQNPTQYLPGGGSYDGGFVFSAKSAIVTPGDDPIVGSLLNTVYNGQYAARVNNWDWDSHVSVISQTVANYSDPFIYFAWAAVLEESHGVGDSDNFSLNLTDDTTGLTLYSVAYDSASTPGYFHSIYPVPYNWNRWYYSDWQVQQLDVSALTGHTFTLTLMGSDCPYTGHGGYVYLDGFGATPPPPTGVPEPATIFMLGAGLAGIVALRRTL